MDPIVTLNPGDNSLYKPWTVEDPDRRESKNNKVNSVARKISTVRE